MGRIRRWLYLALGMVAWRVGKVYVRRRLRRRDRGQAGAEPAPPPA